MTENEKLPVFGYRGNSYFFTVHALTGHNLASTGGVYIFAKRVSAPNPVFTIMYIGQSSSLANVSTQQAWLQSNGVNSICVLPVEKQEDRLNIVEELIDRYKPECNMVANS
jgi:hypothetical protein